MEFVKLSLSPNNTYSSLDSSAMEMSILGDFLSTDLENYSTSLETWALDNASRNMSGALTKLEKNESHIILGNLSNSNVLRIKTDQFLQILTDWQEKVHKPKPQAVTITYNLQDFSIETNSELQIDLENSEQKEEHNQEIYSLIPHQYPFLIKWGFITCCLLFIKSLPEFPYFFRLSERVQKAHQELNLKNYTQASILFEKLCSELPDNKYMKRYLAQSLFKSENVEDHIRALHILGNIKLKKDEWKELLNYMPAEYTQFFESTRER
jgi:hypothetical protein